MKIFFLQKVKALVGSEKYFLEVLPELNQRGITTKFFCVINHSDRDKADLFVAAAKEKKINIEVLYVSSDKSILKVLKGLRKSIQDFQPDLVHSHLIHADFWCALLKKTRRINVPIVSTKHGYDEAYIAKHGFDPSAIKANRYFKMAKFAEQAMDYSFAVSHGLKRLYIGAGICSPTKITTIHHGFDLEEPKSNSNTRQSPHQLIVIGRIIPFKGHRHLIAAMPKIVEAIPNVHLQILGHGDEKLIHQLKRSIQENNIETNITFTGYQSNIYDYLLNADLMVVPSIAEGFGLVFLEALNAKLPVVGFDVPATNEIVDHQENGVLVQPYNEEELAKAIITLLNNKDKAQNFGEKGKEKLKTYFSLDRMVTQTIAFYHQALNQHAADKAK